MTRFAVACLVFGGWLLGGAWLAASVRGEEPTGLQAAMALEDVLVRAIARSERSVVAIARIRHGGTDRRADLSPNPFNRLRAFEPQLPGDPGFIPNEYATGVVVGPGLILTANHVLRDESDYWVTTADRRPYRVLRVVGADPRSDLAVLQIEARDLTPIKFGDASKLKKGQIVIALGNPYAIARDGQVSASWGIISNLARKDAPSVSQRDEVLNTSRTTLHQYGTLIQTDARLNLGTSGGALVNLQGEMVGMTVSLAALAGTDESGGFALAVDETFQRALKTLKEGREVEYGFLGVAPKSLSPDEVIRGRHGVLIEGVVIGTPADRAGLQVGDLITNIDGQEIFEPDDLMLAIGKLPADGSARVTVERNGRQQVLAVNELSKYWVSGKKIVSNPPPAWRGLHVDYMTASRDTSQWAQHFRIDPHGAVLVTDVDENSPAWKEGLRANMLISHVGGNPVGTPKQFREAVSGKDGPVRIRLSLAAGERPDRPERVIAPDGP